MKQHFTLKSLLAILCLSFGFNLQGQNVLPISINVETAGTLSSIIPASKKYLITDLTLSGNLNGSDIRFIRDMAGRDYLDNNTDGKLNKLNLNDAKIVSGGDYYYFDDHSSDHNNCYTTNNVISNCMFYNLNKLTSITLPNSVTSVGDLVFHNCTGLTSFTIPESVTKIGYQAFHYCTGLTSISIPKGVSSIGNEVFKGCSALSEIIVSSENPSYNTIESVLYNKDNTTLIAFPNAKTNTSYTIPNSVTTIGNSAFSDCIKLTSVSIPNSVTKIGDSAFSNCTGLTSVTIPNSVTNIGTYIFNYCSGLTSAILGDNIATVSADAFRGCTKLASVYIPASVTSISNEAFSGCKALKEIYSKRATPPTIGTDAFNGIDKTTCKLYIPKNTYSVYWLASEWGDFTNIIEGPVYLIKTSANEGGKVTKNSMFVKEGGSAIFTINPDKGYKIKTASLNGNDILSKVVNNTYEETPVNADITFDVTFAIIPYYQTSAAYNEGGKVIINDSIIANGKNISIIENDSVRFNVVPNDNFAIEKVILNDKDITASLKNNSYKIDSISAAQAMQVSFIRTHYTLAVKSEGEGKVLFNEKAITDTIKVEVNKPLTLNFTPTEGYKIASVSLNGKDIISDITNNAYTINEVSEDLNIVVSFKDINTAINGTEANGLKVYAEQNSIVIEGANLGDEVSVYTTLGTLMKAVKATEDRIRIDVPCNQIYLIRVAGKSYKVSL